MRSVVFTVPGRLGGKGRPRFVNGMVLTPHKTVVEEGVIKHFAHDAMRQGRLSLLQGPLFVGVQVRLAYPKSWSAKKCGNTLYVQGKPDLDNQLKLLGDAMNGIVFLDDAQIAQVSFERRYIGTGKEESVTVVVRELEDQPLIRPQRPHLMKACHG